MCSLTAQDQTVGLFLNDSTSHNGYTLIAPSTSTSTYLVDNCGELINSWESNYRPGQVAYLMPDGGLLRTCRIGSTFNGGGSGGRIEIHSWEGVLQWSYNYSTTEYHQHHDIELLPNGNILILAWERKTIAQALQAGRATDKLPSNSLWSERVVEVKPVGSNQIEVVWEWHLWDHLVQDFDSLANNYGVVADHPELVDINFTDLGTGSDWVHANAVDYNPELDQVMINSRNFQEFWIVDHSTTTAEAKGHQGGRSGKGGDILYRWGNPHTYRRGLPEEHVFFIQHDAHWIEAGRPGAGQIMVYNNGAGRPGGSYSSIDVLSPVIDTGGLYPVHDSLPFGPDTLAWSYDGRDTNVFYSPRVAGAQRQPNGNTLVCEGTTGRLFEIDSLDRVVWHYQNPVGVNGPVAQGQFPSTSDLFRAYRYPDDHPGIVANNPEPQGPLELEPWPSECVIYDSVSTSIQYIYRTPGHTIYPNPTLDEINILRENKWVDQINYSITDRTGRVLLAGNTSTTQPISLRSLPTGIYFLRIFSSNYKNPIVHKVIKL